MHVHGQRTYHIAGYAELAQRQAAVPHHRVVADVRVHAVEQRANDVVLQSGADFLLVASLDDVEQGGTGSINTQQNESLDDGSCIRGCHRPALAHEPAGDLHVLDAHVPVHGHQHHVQSLVHLRAALEAQPVVQVVQHFGQHDGPVLVDQGGVEDLPFVCLAGDLDGWGGGGYSQTQWDLRYSALQSPFPTVSQAHHNRRYIEPPARRVQRIVQSQEFQRIVHPTHQSRNVRTLLHGRFALLRHARAGQIGARYVQVLQQRQRLHEPRQRPIRLRVHAIARRAERRRHVQRAQLRQRTDRVDLLLQRPHVEQHQRLQFGAERLQRRQTEAVAQHAGGQIEEAQLLQLLELQPRLQHHRVYAQLLQARQVQIEVDGLPFAGRTVFQQVNVAAQLEGAQILWVCEHVEPTALGDAVAVPHIERMRAVGEQNPQALIGHGTVAQVDVAQRRAAGVAEDLDEPVVDIATEFLEVFDVSGAERWITYGIRKSPTFGTIGETTLT